MNDIKETIMRRHLALFLVAGCLSVASRADGQATGMPTFNAPYRAFSRSEIGLVLTFPDGGGTAIEGALRRSNGRFDIGFRGGILDPGGAADAIVLVGAEARQRVLTHTVDFPLDGAVVLGVGAWLTSGNSVFFIPAGLSLGRRIDPQGSQISIVPYVQPTLFLALDGGSEVLFALGLGADFRLSPRFDARISAGLGDREGVSISAVWVH